jgi:hypothetical protein
MFKKWIVLAILAIGVAAVTTACGSDNPGNNNGILTANNGTGDNNGVPDGGPSDASDGGDDAGQADAVEGTDATDSTELRDAADTGDTPDANSNDGGDAGICPGTPCAADETCVEGNCVDDTPVGKCNMATNLGQISPGSPVTITDTTDGASDVLSTSCSAGGIEKVYQFTVTQDSRVSFDTTWSGQMDAKLEFRQDCVTQADDEACFDSDSSIFVPANTNAWLVIEQDVGAGNDFTVELSASPETCPLGQRTCTSGDLEICTGGSQSQTFGCAGDCADTTTCSGDTCFEAIEVTADTTFSGGLKAYNSEINFDGETLCALDNGDTVPTPGRELVFSLPNLTQGQTVHIDASANDSNLNAIFILNSCASAPYQCVDVMVNSEVGDFVAPSAGTYYVVIDKLTTGGDSFTYSFSFP